MKTKSWAAISNTDEIVETIVVSLAISKSSYWDNVDEEAETINR